LPLVAEPITLFPSFTGTGALVLALTASWRAGGLVRPFGRELFSADAD